MKPPSFVPEARRQACNVSLHHFLGLGKRARTCEFEQQLFVRCRFPRYVACMRPNHLEAANPGSFVPLREAYP
eukprot:1909243-Amphidinium_carterae.1